MLPQIVVSRRRAPTRVRGSRCSRNVSPLARETHAFMRDAGEWAGGGPSAVVRSIIRSSRGIIEP